MTSIAEAVLESNVYKKALAAFGVAPDSNEAIRLHEAQIGAVKDAILKRQGFHLGAFGEDGRLLQAYQELGVKAGLNPQEIAKHYAADSIALNIIAAAIKPQPALRR